MLHQVSEEAIARLVETFYGEIRADPELGPIFEAAIGDRWDRHLATMKDFWSSVVNTTGRYKGQPVPVHARLPIAPAHFERWLALWGETADRVLPPPSAALFRANAARIAESLQLALFYRLPGGAPG
jgi:hemoglobin